MRKIAVIGMGCLMLGAVQSSFAADAASLANSCVSCHGAKGISTNPLYPNLAGQKAMYLQKQLQDFKSEKRKDPVMNAMVKSLSDKDIEALAEYYSKM